MQASAKLRVLWMEIANRKRKVETKHISWHILIIIKVNNSDNAEESSKPEAGNVAFWKKKLTEGGKTPYEHLWDFLAKNNAYYLRANNRWQENGKRIPLTKQDVAKAATKYLLEKEIDKDLSAVRHQIRRLDSDCEKALSFSETGDIVGSDLEGKWTLMEQTHYRRLTAFELERQLKICPVWNEAKAYYNVRNSEENPKSKSTPDVKNGDVQNQQQPPEVDDHTDESEDQEETTSVAEEALDFFLNQNENGEDPVEKASESIDEGINKNIELRRIEVFGGLVFQCYDRLKEKYPILSYKDTMEMAKESAKGIMDHK